MSKQVQVSSLAEYVKIITGIISKQETLSLIHEEKLFFRGVKNGSYELVPSIARFPSDDIQNALTWFEERFIHEAKRKLPDVFKDEEYPLNLLTKLQHYGIPTRLLDITSNALVAIYFACQKNREKKSDGEVIVFNIEVENIHSYSSPIANAISESYLFSKYNYGRFDSLLREAEMHSYFNRFKQDMKSEREEYINSIAPRFKEPIFIMPLELSERQKRQQGAFILFPNKIEYNTKFEPNEYELLKDIEIINKENDKNIKKRIIIKNTHKDLILKELSAVGITQDFLFPDSVDVVCKSIKNNIKVLYKEQY